MLNSNNRTVIPAKAGIRPKEVQSQRCTTGFRVKPGMTRLLRGFMAPGDHP